MWVGRGWLLVGMGWLWVSRERMTFRARAYEKEAGIWRGNSAAFGLHCGPDQPRIQNEVLGHSLIHLLVRLHRSLVRLLRTGRFACALRCAHSFARSLTSLTSLVGKWMIGWLFILCFFSILAHSGLGSRLDRRRLLF